MPASKNLMRFGPEGTPGIEEPLPQLFSSSEPTLQIPVSAVRLTEIEQVITAVFSGSLARVERILPPGTLSGELQKRRLRSVPEIGSLVLLGD